MSTAKAAKVSPRERLLRTATQLFTSYGIRAVGIDRILRAAGVAKASLYSAYGSKDGLVVAYLQHMDAADRQAWEDRAARVADPRARILAFFDLVLASGPVPMGAPYIGAALEFPEPHTEGEQAIRDAVSARRTWVLETITAQLRDMGLEDPDNIDDIAARLMVLLDGAATAARMSNAPDSVITARSMAQLILRLVD